MSDFVLEAAHRSRSTIIRLRFKFFDSLISGSMLGFCRHPFHGCVKRKSHASMCSRLVTRNPSTYSHIAPSFKPKSARNLWIQRANMAPTYKIAVAQLYVEPLALEANHAKAISYIRSAASQGCDLVVLPEYHLTSWVPDDPLFATQCAQYKKYLDAYCALAKELHINIVPGTIVEKHENQLLNVASFISPDGKVLGRYQKKNLWHPERPHLTSSAHEPHVALDTPLGRVGMLICWDLAFPEAFRELIADGAKMIIIPTWWTLEDCSDKARAYNPRSEALFLESTLVARCFENTCMVVFANVGGPVGDPSKGSFAGLSQVAVPFQGALGKLGADEGMSVVDVDMDILEEAEHNYKVRADMGKEGWHYEYSLRKDAKAKS